MEGQLPRLLIILNRFVVGGQATDTIPLAWLLKDKFEILIVYGEKEKDEIEPVFLLSQFPGLKLQRVNNLRRSPNPFNDVVAFVELLSVIKTFKPHIVHTHGAKSGILGRAAAWIAGVPVRVHTYHGHFFHSYFNPVISGCIEIVERIAGRITNAVIVLSESQQVELCKRFKIIPLLKSHVIPLGFIHESEGNSFAKRNNFRRRYNLNTNDIAIGIVGRLVPIKNHSFFIKAVAKLSKQTSNASPAYFIIGDGEKREALEDELRAAQISFNNTSVTADSRVVFTSWLTDINEVMQGLDIIVLTSLNEGTPLSIIEAQYFKKPVISTNAGGVKDTLIQGVTGFIVEQQDITTFCDKLRLLIENKELRLKMGEEGYKFVSEKFSKQNEVSLLTNLYYSLLKQKHYSFN